MSFTTDSAGLAPSLRSEVIHAEPSMAGVGDYLALLSAGAYGFVMASNYNSRPLPAEVLVRGNRFSLIRERQTMADLVRGECDASL